MPVPNQFANVTTSIPLSQLDANFNTPITLGNTAIQLGNTVTTLNNMTLANVTVTSGNVTITTGNITVTNANVTTANVTNLTVSNSAVISVNTSGNALRITQTGAGNAFVVEDSSNPDSTPTVITKDGDVIIGGTAAIPSYQYSSPQLNVMGGSAGAQKGGQYTIVFSNDASGASVELGKSRSTTIGTVGTIVQSGDELGIISFNGDDGTDLRTPGATIRAFVDGTPGTNDMPGRLVFSTTADGASTPTERMRLDSSGNLGLGVTPSGWTLGKAIEVGTSPGNGIWGVGASNMNIVSNVYYDGAYKFAGTGSAGTLSMSGGGFAFASSTASGTAGGTISFTDILGASRGNTLYLQGASAQAGTGITFPATQNASSNVNTLDDYEEGTWTPTITAASGTYTTVTASGSYIKVGNAVTVRIRVDIGNNGTAATRMNIANFPFAAENTQSMSGATREDQNTGNGFVASPTGTNSITVNRYDATYGLATGAGFTLCITYITS